jgi:pyruvate kinase
MVASDVAEFQRLTDELQGLRSGLLKLEDSSAELLAQIAEPYAAGARNLVHYIALRRHDLRHLQDRLASLGLSSLGRAEGCVLPTIDAVLQILHRLANGDVPAERPRPRVNWAEGRSSLENHTAALLGMKPTGRSVRIMVTMPGEAADDYSLVRDLLAAGMDCMRINCAHDGADAWSRMIAHLRQAERELNRPCRVLMDLPGPKLRTGLLEPGPQVIKWRPRRDASGRVLAPARICLIPAGQQQNPPLPAAACLPVAADWLARLARGDRIRFRDARGSARFMTITEAVNGSWWAECGQTSYVATGTVLSLRRPGSKMSRGVPEAQTRVADLPALEMPILLKPGDILVLTRDPAPGQPAVRDTLGQALSPAHISCTLPEVFADLRKGERVWLDDGKIGGVLQRVDAGSAEVQIIQAAGKGTKLGADKGINFPDSKLRLPALTPQDLHDLEFIAAHADLVGLSFVHSPEDVTDLQKHLAQMGGERLGIVLKIETRQGFEHLPHVLLAALRSACVGVMIARGDLAVECGYERLAELQEEILWVSEAAHVPVIWATQVLEHLAKDGMPSRAEITDAAMGERAECVMLNKGPHIRQAVRVLDDILRRMQGHQSKKRSMLRPLKLADRFHVSR